MLKRLGLILGLLLGCVGLAQAQGTRYDNFVLNQAGKPVPNAGVYICTSAGSGTPCSPTTPVYSDAALTTIIPQPILTGPLGNYGFYALVGNYTFAITGTGLAGTFGALTIP